MVVNVFIMRHGEAQSVAHSDAARELTARGRQEARQSGLSLSEQVGPFDVVIVSPYIRAKQTCKIVCEATGEPKHIETCEDLTPESSPQTMHDYIDAVIALHRPKNILLVSHMPLVSYLVSEMSNNHGTPIFMTAAVAHISYNATKMKGDLLSIKAP